MTFRELREFFDGSLRLPIGGKVYVVPPISATDGLWATHFMELGIAAAAGQDLDPRDIEKLKLDDDDERDLYERVLGPALEEMRADNVDWPSITRAGQTAFIFFTQGEEAATRIWEGASGEAPAPARAARRQASKGSGSSTRSRASTSGTRSRRS